MSTTPTTPRRRRGDQPGESTHHAGAELSPASALYPHEVPMYRVAGVLLACAGVAVALSAAAPAPDLNTSCTSSTLTCYWECCHERERCTINGCVTEYYLYCVCS